MRVRCGAEEDEKFFVFENMFLFVFRRRLSHSIEQCKTFCDKVVRILSSWYMYELPNRHNECVSLTKLSSPSFALLTVLRLYTDE